MDCSIQPSTGQLTSTSTVGDILPEQSPFLHPGAVTRANTLAIIQLSKDDLIPVYLRDTQGEHDGYKEGHVINTRFGSFPHSTLIGIPWGSQVRASVVDTGSRGRKKKSQAAADKKNSKPEEEGEEDNTSGVLKRKRDANDEGEKRVKSATVEAARAAQDNTATKQPQAAPTEEAPLGDAEKQDENEKTNTEPQGPVAKKQNKSNMSAAQSGFVHILPPTPEIWTTSLPHRTQVVYTPDYSYILQRIRARPGTRLIEAGSGSGSFTHASARAVYNGAPNSAKQSTPTGKVFSFEFHEQRFEKMRREIKEHGLSSVVEVNHRDVYNDGFLVDGKSPQADAVFLDLPAPWLALPHLSRRQPKTGAEMDGVEGAKEKEWVSPLNPKKSVYICTFSPCIEQVTRTVSAMRKLGWVEIDMVEISHKRMQVLREKIGLDIVSDRGVQMAPKDVKEALVKLREVEVKSAEHHAKMVGQHSKTKTEDDDDLDDEVPQAAASKVNGDGPTSQVVEEDNKHSGVKSFMQGRLITKPETELKAHTSYLVFAILPREWTEEDEAAAAAKWPIGNEPRVVVGLDRESRKQQKREMLLSKRKKNKKEVKDGSGKAHEARVENAKGEDVKMEETQG